MAGSPLLQLTALRTLRLPTPSLASIRVLSPARSPAVWRAGPVRSLGLRPALCAGHNKWSKVKNIKGPKDEARARIFNKFGMLIKIAVKEGGSNPELNISLAQLLEQCRNKNMPKASIEAAIKSAAKPGSQHMFEARGPGGCLLLIEVLTDNNSRAHQEIKRLLTKNGGMLSDGARNQFNRTGVVVVSGQNITNDKALELAIEAGAEDVQETEDEEEKPILQFLCNMADVKTVRSSLEELGMQVVSAGVEFIPRTFSSLDEDKLTAASALIGILSDYPDVVRVWDNIQVDS